MSEVGIRIVRVDKGLTLSGEDIKACTISRKVDFTFESCPYGTCQLSIYNKNGVEYDFQENEKIEVYKDDILDGVFFLKDIKQNSIYSWNIYAVDYIGRLEDLPFMGGDFSNSTDLLNAIEEQSGITLDYPNIVTNHELEGYMLYDNCKTALEQFCFLLRTMADTSGINGIRLRRHTNQTSQIIDKKRVLVGSKVTEDYNNIDGVVYEEDAKIFDPAVSPKILTVFSSDSDKLGQVRVIDYGTRLKNVVFDGYKPIIKTSVSALVERVDNGSENSFVYGEEPNLIVKNKYSYYPNPSIISNVIKVNEISLKSDVSMNGFLSSVYSANVNRKKISCKIANKKTVAKKASTYGEYLYGETVYGYNEVIGISYDNPVNIGDLVVIPTEYGNYRALITSEKYSLNSHQIVKNIEAVIV